MTDNIEWGEWVMSQSGYDMVSDTRGKFLEMRFDTEGNRIAYRMGAPRQPVVTMQLLFWRRGYEAGINWAAGLDTHRIAITMHDGKPVGIAIEELK